MEFRFERKGVKGEKDCSWSPDAGLMDSRLQKRAAEIVVKSVSLFACCVGSRVWPATLRPPPTSSSLTTLLLEKPATTQRV